MRLENFKRNERLEGVFNRVAALLDAACGKGALLFPATHSVGKRGK